MWTKQLIKNKEVSRIVRSVGLGAFLTVTLLTVGFSFVLWSHHEAYKQQRTGIEQRSVDPFPLGVDPNAKMITEQPAADQFYRQHIAGTFQEPQERSWFAERLHRFRTLAWIQNLASPASRVLVIEPGERSEQIVDNFGDILHWTTAEREHFSSRIASTTPALKEGKYFPERYVVHADASPEQVATLVRENFTKEVLERYTPDIDAAVPLRDALTIASLLEREAYSFEDMRNISGVLWNRLFIDMRLQVDASLQYIKGSRPYGPWWPKVTPSDKFLSSPYNTYEHDGLPPTPIANPSLAAVVAALNPKKTDCLFYFHNRSGDFFCAQDYDAHVELLRQEYGRGR